MVDPLVAKQLALVQLEQRRKNANFVVRTLPIACLLPTFL
jgi:hypothetical protein